MKEGLGNYSVLATNVPDKLIAGMAIELLTDGILLKVGQGVLLRGSVIGIEKFIIGDVTDNPTNTGDGTITGFAINEKVELGVYNIVCIAADANAGTFAVYSPSGYRLADAEVGVVYVNNQLSFQINDGAADFIVGDEFNLEVTEGTKGILCDANSVDGSQMARYVLAEPKIDTTDGDAIATCYETGIFNRQALIFGENGAPNTLENDLRSFNIQLLDEKAY